VIYLLDSNVWIAFLRRPASPVVARLQAHLPTDIRTCAVVVGELRYGCLRSAKPAANLAKVEALLVPYASLPFDDHAADQYATVRRHLETRGLPIGPYDLQIAGIALAHGCTLVTHNQAEFSRVPGLLLEDWETLSG
jgi:tRNA(fMet)-specific endonuclease VapC